MEFSERMKALNLLIERGREWPALEMIAEELVKMNVEIESLKEPK